MRFRHLSLDEQLKQTEKKDEKTVAKAQLLKSKEWQDHVTEHHGTGPKAQLVEVTTPEDSDLSKKADEKKETKDEPQQQQHTVDHPDATSRTGYLGNTVGTAQRGANDAYFGAGSARLQAISGQCSCGMEISTGWQPEQPKAPLLTTGYTNPLERDRDSGQQQPLYASGISQLGTQQQERSLYTTGQPTPGLGTASDQRRRRTSAL